MKKRVRLTNRKEAQKYDNESVLSLNNPYESPDPDKYDLDTPDNFQEKPDMRTEWQKDKGAYDPDHNFMMPLDDTPSWWGQGPKMSMGSAKMASMKAEACLKIAEHLFPDAVDDFVDAQAADLMEMPNGLVLNTLKRMAMYKEEPLKVSALLGKVANEAEAEEDAPSDEDAMNEVAAALGDNAAPAAEAPAADLDLAPAEDEEGEAPPIEEDEDEMDLAATTASMNPSTEFGDFFEHDADIEDVSYGNGVTASVNDQDLNSLFADENFVQPNQLRKSASVKTNKNLQLSKHLGNTVPRTQSAIGSLWDVQPNVSESFK